MKTVELREKRKKRQEEIEVVLLSLEPTGIKIENCNLSMLGL